MKKVELECSGCKALFLRAKKEYDRQIKLGKTDFYCTRQCVGRHVSVRTIQSDKVNAWRNSSRNKTILAKWNRSRLCNPFRYYMHTVRKRHWDFDIDQEYLQKLWEEQEGKCAFSGLMMHHDRWGSATDPFSTASLDRIDSQQGYLRENVQFVIRALNLAKGAASDEKFRTFLNFLVDSSRVGH